MRDLFGFVPVSLREIELWLFKVPRLPAYSTRRADYVRGWNVVSKIQRAKLAGTLADSLGDESCEFCGQTLCAVLPAPSVAPAANPEQELARLRARVAVLELILRVSTKKPITCVS